MRHLQPNNPDSAALIRSLVGGFLVAETLKTASARLTRPPVFSLKMYLETTVMFSYGAVVYDCAGCDELPLVLAHM